MSERDHVAEPKNFEPKVPVKLDPPKNDPINLDHLSRCNGEYFSSANGTTAKGHSPEVKLIQRRRT